MVTFTLTIMAFQSFAQVSENNFGATCGCPPVNSRPSVLMSSVANITTGELLYDIYLTCNNTYILDRQIYVPSGRIINIAPGSVIKGKPFANPANAPALVIERGGKINADGSADCPIIFTAESDNLNGTFSIANKGLWGGLVICGRASNNLTFFPNGAVHNSSNYLAIEDGLGRMEGFAQDEKLFFGAALNYGEVFDDNDNSGTLKYVSIRYAGAISLVGSEINALSLGSVGRGTKIEHIEIISSLDDGIECFGGTVNIKYAALLFGNDDMFDYDLGYTGKIQFLFGLKTDLTASIDSDNGIEADSDDQKSNNSPRSHPVIYNTTIIGNNKTTQTQDNSSIAAINVKELAEGEIYNSVFANFKNGVNLVHALGTRTGGSESYHNWSAINGNGSQSLKIKCNTFIGVTNNLTIDNAPSMLTADMEQFSNDLNIINTGIPGFNYTLTINNITNVISPPSPDVTPNPALSNVGCPTPSDGFFVNTNYRGAFSPFGTNWLSPWSYASVIKVIQGTQPCLTDINGDGSTSAADLNLLVPQYSQKCK